MCFNATHQQLRRQHLVLLRRGGPLHFKARTITGGVCPQRDPPWPGAVSLTSFVALPPSSHASGLASTRCGAAPRVDLQLLCRHRVSVCAQTHAFRRASDRLESVTWTPTPHPSSGGYCECKCCPRHSRIDITPMIHSSPKHHPVAMACRYMHSIHASPNNAITMHMAHAFSSHRCVREEAKSRPSVLSEN